MRVQPAGLVVAQQEHNPPAGAHFVLLGAVVVAALAAFGVKWWRGRRDATAAHQRSSIRDHPAENARSTEEE
jgi:hypothetical protein